MISEEPILKRTMGSRPTLCLNMIVKNEMVNLGRCLESVAPYVSCWIVCDTGSTDGTQEFIRSFFAARGIPGELHSFPFVDFSQARNAALERAAASPIAYDYLLLADADMELMVEDQDFLERLDAPAHRLVQRTSSGLVYWNTRLIRRNTHARYHGVTHEYLDVPGHTANLQGIWYRDHATGANRVNKFDRDIRLLQAGLDEEPKNSRYWFYLAQSYRDAGLTAKAEKAYSIRADMGGWAEEAWHARLSQARCLLQLGEEGGFLRQAMIAFNQRPHRAEPLYDLARFYRERGMNEASLIFAEQGLRLPLPEDDVLFLEDFVYTSGLREEFSIAANYAQDPNVRDRGFSACNWLSLNRSTPTQTRNLATSNLYFYVKQAAEMMPSFATTQIAFKPPDGYRTTNPSVSCLGNDIVIVQRVVNYALTESGDYLTQGDVPIHTRNFLLTLNAALGITSAKEILPPVDLPEPAFRDVQGFEDMRPFEWRGEIWAIACMRELAASGRCEQVLARIDTRGDYARLMDFQVLRPKRSTQHEKNWMPLVDNQALRFVYSCSPTRIIDAGAGTVSCLMPAISADRFLGGTQVISFRGGWLAVIHERRMMCEDRPSYYLHRFVWFDTTGALKGVSRPFFFNIKGIEFAAGLAWHPDSERLIISYGVKDAEAWISTVEAGDVLDALEDAERLPSGNRAESPTQPPWCDATEDIPASESVPTGTSTSRTDAVWLALMQRSRTHRVLGNESEFRACAEEALRLQPHRAEPMQELARYCLSKSQWDEATLYADAGLALSLQETPGVQPRSTETDLREVFSIAASRASDYEQRTRGGAICNWLAIDRDLPARVRNLARFNLSSYAEPAQALMESLEIHPLAIATSDGYSVGSVSIVREGPNILLVVCQVKGERSENGGSEIAGDTAFRSRLALLSLDEKFSTLNAVPVDEPEDMPLPRNGTYLGFEGPRLFRWGGELWCLCSVCQLNADGVGEMVLARIDRRQPDRFFLTDWRVLESGMPRQWQKNWMPLVVDDELRFLYSVDPTRIIDSSGAVVRLVKPAIAVESLKGGSQAISFDGGWLIVVHEWELVDDSRHYFHRLVWFDEEYNLRRLTRRFWFEHAGEEFASGIAWHPDGKRLMISFSVCDCAGRLAVVQADDCRASLIHVDGFRRASDEAAGSSAVVDRSMLPPTAGEGHKRSTRSIFQSLAPFLGAIDSPQDRRLQSRCFDERIAEFLGNGASAALPQIHCFYEVMGGEADHTTLIASTQSMRDAGHPVRVWSYQADRLAFLVNHGIELRDAADVVPRGMFERIVERTEIRYFSDIFRYAALYEHGGLWMDTDVVMLRSFPFCGDHFLNLQWWHGEKDHFVCGNVIYAEAYSRHMRNLYELSLERLFGAALTEFGEVGPKLLSSYLATDEGAPLRDRLFSPMFFNAIDWTEVDQFNRPIADLGHYLNDDRVIGIHLWNARVNAMSRDRSGSLLSSLLAPRQHLPSLVDLADRFDTDKNRHTGNRHCYTRVYDRLLGPKRFALQRLMEIGLCRGLAEGCQSETPSVALWQAYFPYCHVVGVDLTDFSRLNNTRFTSFVCDQSKLGDLRAVASKFVAASFDAIIDDGSHYSADQQQTLVAFFPLLAEGGWYFIEDLDWQPPDEDRRRAALTKNLLNELKRQGAIHSPDPFNIGRLATEIAEIRFFDSHYEIERAGLTAGLVAIRKRTGNGR